MTTLKKTSIEPIDLRRAEQVLLDNGIDYDDVMYVLRQVGLALLDTDLYPKD